MATRIAVLTDFHLSTAAIVPEIEPYMGPLFLERALRRINMHLKPDLVVVLGDIVQDKTEVEVTCHLERTADLLKMLDCPWFVLPGNHDPDDEIFYSVFNEPPEYIDVNDVRVIPFRDAPAPQWMATRSRPDIERMRHHRQNFGGTIITAHHVPLFPPDRHDCPYNYTNVGELLEIMHRGGRWLSLGGHYHAGAPAFRDRDVSFSIGPSLWDPPHQFMLVTVDGDDITTENHRLQLPPELNLVDTHIHSQFAYCSRDSQIDLTAPVAEAMGLGGAVITEHSGQLYYDEDTYWSAEPMRHGLDDRTGQDDRTTDYIKCLDRAGVPKWARGLELDCDFQGRPMAEPDMMEQMGTLIGSIHGIPAVLDDKDNITADVTAEQMMSLLPKFAASGIDILAHPFRLFHRTGAHVPASLFPQIVKILKENNVAAELNFHWQFPKREFVEQCIDAGVKLALGSDAHWLWEIGELSGHLALLEELGCMDRLDEVLYDPRTKR